MTNFVFAKRVFSPDDWLLDAEPLSLDELDCALGWLEEFEEDFPQPATATAKTSNSAIRPVDMIRDNGPKALLAGLE